MAPMSDHLVQGSDEWLAARCGLVTASRISDVMMDTHMAGYRNYLAQLVCERLTGQPTEFYVNADMQRGTDLEPQARALYELNNGVEVEQVGFVVHPDIPMSGSSPDGLVGDYGGLEIKCPKPANHIDTILGGNVARNYRLQMQWNMLCTGRKWWDFVSFCPVLPPEMAIYQRRFNLDLALAEEITESVRDFLADVAKMDAQLKSKYRRAA